MKNTHVQSSKLQDATVPPKEPLQRQHDVLILLIVIAVLSTLLAVIVLSTLIWICYKFYNQTPLFSAPRRSRFRTQQDSSFPPHRRDIIEMDDFAGRLNSLLQQRDPHPFGPGRTSTSKDLGYKDLKYEDLGYRNPGYKHKLHTSNFSVPVLSGPSLTPSPHQQNENLPEELNHLRLNQYRNFYARDPCMASDRGPRLQRSDREICPEELRERLESINRHEHSFRKNWNVQRSSKFLRAPANTPSTTPYKSTYQRSDTSEEADEQRERSIPRRNIEKRTTFVENFDNSLVQTAPGEFAMAGAVQAAKKQKPISSSPNYEGKQYPGSWDFGKRGAIPKQFQMRSSPLPETKQAGTQVNMAEETPGLQLQTPKFNLQNVPKRKFRKIKKDPPPVFLESPSTNSSTELTPILKSKSYMKIYHPPDEDETIYVEADEDEYPPRDVSSESTLSMSWDHLTPEPSPTQVQLPNILVDPAQGTVFYIHDRVYNKAAVGSRRDKCEKNETSKAG